MPFADDERSDVAQKYYPPDAARRRQRKNTTDNHCDTDESPASDSEEEQARRLERTLPKLPEDVVVRVLMHAGVEDIGNSRLTCRMWRDAIDAHELELWQGRCNAYDLFPPVKTDTGMGIASDNFRLLVAKIRRDAPPDDMRRELTRAYRRHYWEWAPTCYRRICDSRPVMQACCADPSGLPWNITGERWLMAYYCRYVIARFCMLTDEFPDKQKKQATIAERVSRSWAEWVDGKFPNNVFVNMIARMFQATFPYVDIAYEYRCFFHMHQMALRQ